MRKRLFSMVLCVAMTVSLLVGCGSKATDSAGGSTAAKGGDGYTIGISVLNMTGQFFIQLVDAAKAEAEANGCTLMTNDANDDSATQIDAVENFISAGCNAIIICAVDPEAIQPVVKKAQEDGIKIVCLTAKIDGYDAYIGCDEHTLGYTQGVAVGKMIADKYGKDTEVQAATLNYDLMESVIARKEGIMEGILENAPNVKFVADATAADQEEGMTNTENFLQANPDIKVVCGVSDGAALGAYQAFKAAGMTDPEKYIIAGIDATDEALKLINEGSIYQATVDQNPGETGKNLVATACAILDGKDFEKDSLYNLIAVTPDNIGDYDL
ncbi:sugar ABC transporter substrate-binding protein [Clostridium sp. C105KSO13]|uniref:sugar ABC transporter substrate-binding protein n=1 Tax=Clostridium sp. C105KSO13 TaxID=1776045 RepID=UPI0007407814|nr:sugar ABC transporter substrate-binding protein [Clostridium sp. C105KSO13]CUX29976.1 D-ribose-binding periplasmic protein precursor [Clostridium sp. C105KSO13]